VCESCAHSVSRTDRTGQPPQPASVPDPHRPEHERPWGAAEHPEHGDRRRSGAHDSWALMQHGHTLIAPW